MANNEPENLEELLEEDLYGLLGVDPSATLSQIQKGWRKKSVKCHPDKFPDNPTKAAMFLKITSVLDLLCNPKLKARYDNKNKARAIRLANKRKLGEKTRKFRDDLEERERAYKRQKTDSDTEKINLAAEIERLREDGMRKLREQEQRRAEKVKELQKVKEKKKADPTLHLKWNKKEKSYTKVDLERIFSPFGPIDDLIVGAKGNRAVLVFRNAVDALQSSRTVSNHPIYKLEISWASGAPPLLDSTISADSQPSVSHGSVEAKELMDKHLSFEEQILAQMMASAGAGS